MSGVLERFLRYVQIETTSDESSATSPTTTCQWDLLRLLEREMRELGMEGVHLSEYGVLRAALPGSGPRIGLIAHVDTSPEAPGAGVKPVLHAGWDGSPITLAPGICIDPSGTADMKRYAGGTIVTSDGSTLLGADDKAGVAIIMEACSILLADPSLPRPALAVAFTPDEEAGRGVEHFDTTAFGASLAYTVDGGPVGHVETQTFNAAAADLRVTGRQVHPGSAKGLMVNAARIASEMVASLGAEEMPENSEGMQGYTYPLSIAGNAAEARIRILLRDFTREGLEARASSLEALGRWFSVKYPGAAIELSTKEQYRNPAEVLSRDRRLVERAMEGIRAAGLDPVEGSIRGGTDGSRLSFMGIPCVNLPTGGEMFHSRTEWIAVEGIELALSSLLGTLAAWASGPASGD